MVVEFALFVRSLFFSSEPPAVAMLLSFPFWPLSSSRALSVLLLAFGAFVVDEAKGSVGWPGAAATAAAASSDGFLLPPLALERGGMSFSSLGGNGEDENGDDEDKLASFAA